MPSGELESPLRKRQTEEEAVTVDEWSDLRDQVMSWVREGFCCAQIMVLAGLAYRGEENADLVAAVDHPGFRLHLDAGGFALSDEDWEPVVREAMPLVAHVHASQPQLVSFSTPDPVHARLAALLREGGYRGTVAIEMRQQTDVWEAVESAVRTIASLYGPEPASPA